MTISDTATKFRYEGNAVTDTFAFSGKAFTAADLVVEIITRATDALEETLTITTDYTVTIATDGTASITTVVGKIPSATQDIQIRRALAQTQTVVLPTGTKFPAKSVETAIDRAVGLSQDLEEAVNRSMKFPATSSTTVATLPEPVDNATITFNGTTGAFQVGPTSTAITNAETNATAAAASAAAAATSETNAATSESSAAASAAGVNLPSITATDTGSILQVNAAGTSYELLTAGTAGKVLTSNGPDAALSYEDAGSMVLLSTQTASASSTINFTLDSTYSTYKIIITDLIPTTDQRHLWGRVSVASSYKSGASDYKWISIGFDTTGGSTAAGAGDAADNQIYFTGGASLGNPIGNVTNESLSGEITISNPSNTSIFKMITGRMYYTDDAGDATIYDTTGFYIAGVQAIDGFQLLMSTDTIATGTFKFYGIV